MPGKVGRVLRAGCYTLLVITREDEEYFLNPPPGSAAARAVEFGIDLTLTLENLRLTPEERIHQLDHFILAVEELQTPGGERESKDASVHQSDQRAT
jgi:hypothetical protein